MSKLMYTKYKVPRSDYSLNELLSMLASMPIEELEKMKKYIEEEKVETLEEFPMLDTVAMLRES